MKQYINAHFRHMLHGGDYSPEQWLDAPDVLTEDMRLMRLAGCNAMTIGMFAWTALEPEEGRFDFSFLDRTMDEVYANGGRVVLGTPSGARPAWLSQKYPEVLRTNENHSVNTHGKRQNHCLTSPVYREKVAKIDALLAQRYQNHPALIAWHISNEFGGACYCERCKAAFREWLKNKYGTLDALNRQWWTAFWSHTYTDWNQIDPPSALGEAFTHGLNLDWKRFVTDQTADFIRNEVQAIKPYTPDVPVTTNLMGFFAGLDYHVICKELDVISHDSYPSWKGQPSDIALAAETAAVHDLNRSLLHKPFMLMECTPSLVNWQSYNKLKRPGMHMLASMQAIAHGSDTVKYFQWRKSRGCYEKFHGAVVDHVGHENTHVFREVAALGERLAMLDRLVGTQTVSRVAMLFDWPDFWAVENAGGFQNQDKKMKPTFFKHYRPLWNRGINTDIIGCEDDFSKYDLLIAPMLYLIDSRLEEKLTAYVRSGGTLLCTYMTGMVNENDLVHLGGFPVGRLKEVFGIWNEEIDTLYPDECNLVECEGETYRAVDYCEIIHPSTASVLAAYTTDFYSGEAAATINAYGRGKACYLAFRDEGDFTDRVTGYLLELCGIQSDFDGPLPGGVTAHSRTDGEYVFVFLQNYNREVTQTFTDIEWITVDTHETIRGNIALAPYETKILSRKIPSA